jgi:2-polyprenyl-3-methyl-5-hydroxy-6-metoxy-1,4-benzoquinol methylase
MKYYYREHALGYQKVKADGKTAWAEIHGHAGFENFASRAFLELALPRLHFPSPDPAALEVGCGTGPGACFLAVRGFQVDGIDLIPTAIDIAREQARVRGLEIHYQVQDICQLPHGGKQYNLIVDSYCLQGIVTDDDRAKVFAAVRARLKPAGYYLISTAMFDQARFRECKRVIDPATGIVYNRYGKDGLIDLATHIVYSKLPEAPTDYGPAIEIDGDWYLLNRRHLTPPALKMELRSAGFDALYQDDEYGGNVICVLE